ncbi:MAG: tRNA (adenosine(37)-N6)-threonylcarbamoyltransferase complex ATPase subunit type 1 TsaE, partial [Chitinophagales bacterium]|nr:tRNA (adenosine(37)-N6)-threonylcarbamoyltransferase complex ATPase subunit type 1 TsaE [Chitinophagales bacterium]
MTFEIIINSIDELASVAKNILMQCEGRKIFAFEGEMASGKTTIIKALCKELGIEGNAVSPTFSIVNEYKGEKNIFHIDLYRVKNMNEALDIGIEEYLSGNEFCFIEWPGLILSLLPHETVKINICAKEKDQR